VSDHIPWGLDTYGSLRSAVDVPRGLACACHCANCNGALEACKGEIVSPYFRHAKGACAGGGETALLLFAKKAIRTRAGDLVLPDKAWLGNVTSVDVEPWMGDLRPDAVVHYAREPVAIEVLVTHRTSQDKIAKYTIAAVTRNTNEKLVRRLRQDEIEQLDRDYQTNHMTRRQDGCAVRRKQKNEEANQHDAGSED
jgi:hypothetical protein